MRFRKKPVEVEAVQWTGSNTFHLLWFGGGKIDVSWSNERELLIRTLEGYMTASVGDWIIKGVQGEFYPCKPDIFALTYERV